MANFGFGSNNPGEFGAGFNAQDFDRLARQYWGAWGEMMRGASPQSAQASMPGWNEAVNWWSQMAKGGNPQVEDTLDRFNSQARGWFGEIQKLAAQFAGSNASAGDIAGAWKQALGGGGANPFADMFGSMRGPGQQDFSRWAEQIAPFLERAQHEGQSLLGLPAFGFAREHQERVQQLVQANADYQKQSQAYNALMAEAGQEAFSRFEDKLAERSEPGRQIASARGLFDLWIDAAEEAYAEIALSPRFRDAYAALVNSQMRLRAGVQKEIEQASGSLGIPTRTEIDSAHRKIVQLERELRRLRDELHNAKPARVAEPQAKAEPAAAPPAKAVVKKVATKASAKARTAVASAAVPSKSAAPARLKAVPSAAAAPSPAKKAAKKTAIARPQPPSKPLAAAAKPGKRAKTAKLTKRGAR
ncbi:MULTISPECIES: class III poly(R)-hydroxyalkanoic acid synthase subunit PhaE [unclassified Lysobacter]|uniref:class III poly(R)-hydroxyalkanoic acid synthase subunit PhaE n=1 Tax=unclassified Lysobacter TaxID=2635362 RepID=UPI001BEC070F|nr:MULTISPECIES: class III poly(R)-hydroxyalkanoic acid synthase subunit PhaE [unclassified Lysobacter]MBT2746728.1 class III poly(R)-hydroxyalkanoic acid synthase subunit PhaE [Lysobacter sp. ISL-42]MBT2751777.1 class III poly(R)-hydroxyalkanoic acid synthase subunit PhaE [Lysobacter sp. ISL-50]MBT2778129.1 class III poly(R)-hydroxyalkanoic acid synthase subunit PhaE [Lysobacter sp. ISL-54]MBT2781770.1 class III poly(R)-hydroxyalkanoic acid synthase subunit PhaE [Lysobacter sp. ISL-52]